MYVTIAAKHRHHPGPFILIADDGWALAKKPDGSLVFIQPCDAVADASKGGQWDDITDPAPWLPLVNLTASPISRAGTPTPVKVDPLPYDPTMDGNYSTHLVHHNCD